VAIVSGAAACGDDGEDDVAVLRVVTGSPGEEQPEYRFEVPSGIAAGATRLALTNAGDEPHHAQVFRLDDGASVADLAAALANGGPPAALEVGSFVGGTGLVAPGRESRADAILDLEPGRYALICFVPDAEGMPHVAHGMLQPFEVGASDDPSPGPDVDVDVELADFRFELPDSIAGDDVLAITNRSTAEQHEMVFARLEDGVTVDDVIGALHGGTPLPAVGVGGMQALPPGATQRLQLDLEPGRYVVLCAVPSADGTPHYDAGMIEEVTVT
jgi:hypothetical protein